MEEEDKGEKQEVEETLITSLVGNILVLTKLPEGKAFVMEKRGKKENI